MHLKDALDYLIGSTDWMTRTQVYEWILSNTERSSERVITLTNNPQCISTILLREPKVGEFIQSVTETFGSYKPDHTPGGICGAYKSVTLTF